jgi:hypothetical protein
MVMYAATVVLSACLLFLIQPLITKMIFPWFGGTSAVWIVALMFFQVCLLCGYGYAHWLNRFSSRKQALIHTGLLIGACLTRLPDTPNPSFRRMATRAGCKSDRSDPSSARGERGIAMRCTERDESTPADLVRA